MEDEDDARYESVPFEPAGTVRVRYVPGEPIKPLPWPEETPMALTWSEVRDGMRRLYPGAWKWYASDLADLPDAGRPVAEMSNMITHLIWLAAGLEKEWEEAFGEKEAIRRTEGAAGQEVARRETVPIAVAVAELASALARGAGPVPVAQLAAALREVTGGRILGVVTEAPPEEDIAFDPDDHPL